MMKQVVALVSVPSEDPAADVEARMATGYDVTEPDLSEAVARLVREYRRLRGLVAGQRSPCVLFWGPWSEEAGGHELRTRAGRGLTAAEREKLGVPDFPHLDGGYAPGSDEIGRHPSFQPQGLVRTTYVAGWTVFAFWDRTCDRRGGSNAAFLVEGVYEYADLAPLARRAFPQVWARLGDTLREETPESYRRMALGGEF